MKVLRAFFFLFRAANALVGEVTTAPAPHAAEATLAPPPHDLSNSTDGVVFQGIELASNGTEGMLELNATAGGSSEGLEAIAGLNNNIIDDSLSTPPPLPPSTAAPAPAASSALPTASIPEEPATVAPTPPDDAPSPPLPDFLASDVPSPPEFLSFNEWKEKFAVLPDISARRSKKAAQRSRQDATNANGGGDATFDGDGLDFGSLFASEDGGVHKVGYEGGGVQKHVEMVQLRSEGSTRDELAANDSQRPVTEAPPTDLSIGTSASPIQPLPHTGSGDVLDPLIPLRDRTNYALFECAAMVHRSSPQSKGASSILVEKKDRYMLTPCSAEPKFVELELCDEIKIDTIVLANFEFFSSMFKHFSIKVSVNYPGRADEWHDLGTFRARNMRGIQAFHPKSILGFYRYMRIDFVSHYGSEFYCPVSLLRVYGITQMDAYRREAEDEKEKQAAAALSAAEADEEDALDVVEVTVVEELVAEKPTTLQVANATMEEPLGSNSTITSMSNTITATSSEVSSSPSVERSIDSSDPESTPASTATSTTTSTATSAVLPASTPVATLAPSPTLDITSVRSTLVTPAVSATTVHTSIPNPKERVESTAVVVAPSQNLTTTFTAVEPPASEMETPILASSETVTTISTEVLVASSQVVPSTVFVPEATPTPTPTIEASTSVEIPTTAAFVVPSNDTATDASPSALNVTTATASPVPSDPAVPSNSTTTTSRTPPIESSTASRASPSSEPTESRRPPPPMPPPVQPTPGESIYGTIMKRLTSLEHNQTLSMHYIEAQSAMLREAFGRVEKRLAVFEGGRDMQEALVREAIGEMDKHRLGLDRDRVALALQLNILTQEVLFEKRLGVVLLMGLLALFVFVGVTRGSSPTPFLGFVPARERRYERNASNTSEEVGEGDGGDRVEELVDGHRKTRIRGTPMIPRTPSLKHHSTPSKASPRRPYGPLTSSKPPRLIRAWTPPQRAGSLPSEGTSSAMFAGQAQTEVRRRKGAGAEIFRDYAIERVRRHSGYAISSPRMLGEDPPEEEGERLRGDEGGSRDSMDERGYKTLSGSEDEGTIAPLVLERSSPPKAAVEVRPRSSSGRIGGGAETPPRFVPRSTLPSPPPEPVKVLMGEERLGEERLGEERKEENELGGNPS